MNKLPFRRNCVLLLVFVPLLVIFKIEELFLSGTYLMTVPLDYKIPFIPFFVVFYLSWFLYQGIAVLYFMFRSVRDFYRIVAFLAVSMLLSYAVFFAFPSRLDLRPEYAGDGLFAAAVGLIYKFDTPANVFPSIHVLNSLGVHVCVCKSELFKGKRGIKSLSLFVMVMINLSTLFIKQHSLLDVGASLLLFVPIAYVLLRPWGSAPNPAGD